MLHTPISERFAATAQTKTSALAQPLSEPSLRAPHHADVAGWQSANRNQALLGIQNALGRPLGITGLRPSQSWQLRRNCTCGDVAGPDSSCTACQAQTLRRALRSTVINSPNQSIPPSVYDVLRSPGRPLEPAPRGYMEGRLGVDLGDVRVHTGLRADASAQAINASAYTVGRDVVFAHGQFAPETNAGRRLLAHELVHVVQNRAGAASSTTAREIGSTGDAAELEAELIGQRIGGGATGTVQAARRDGVIHRFEKSERRQVTKLDDILKTAQDIANRSLFKKTTFGITFEGIEWSTFVELAGGFSAVDRLVRAASIHSAAADLPNRYLFTCRCGMVDMRHFYQLMYIGITLSNRSATARGREHELHSEKESKFAAEDTPSNALGAFFGTLVSTSLEVQPSEFVSDLRTYLQVCAPVDFTSMSTTDQDTVVNYYGNRNPDGTPANPNETATPTALSVVACGAADRGFPFVLDPTDPEHKTIRDTASRVGLTFNLKSDTEIRDWVAKHDAATIGSLPVQEKIRFINRLLDGYVHEEDLVAIETICNRVGAAAEMKTIRDVISPRATDLDFGQRERLRLAIRRI